MLKKRYENQTKKDRLTKLANKYYALQELIDRNKEKRTDSEKIPLPFIVVATEESPSNHIRIECNQDRNKLAIFVEKPMVLEEDLDLIQKLRLKPSMPDELLQLLNSSIFLFN